MKIMDDLTVHDILAKHMRELNADGYNINENNIDSYTESYLKISNHILPDKFGEILNKDEYKQIILDFLCGNVGEGELNFLKKLLLQITNKKESKGYIINNEILKLLEKQEQPKNTALEIFIFFLMNFKNFALYLTKEKSISDTEKTYKIELSFFLHRFSKIKNGKERSDLSKYNVRVEKFIIEAQYRGNFLHHGISKNII